MLFVRARRLAPGVNYCTEIGQANVNVVIDVQSTEVPEECKRKVQKDSQMLLMYTGDAGPSANGPWQRFVAQEDFTVAEALKMKGGGMPTGFTMGMEGLCEGTKAVLTFPAAVGFDDPQSKAVRPPNVAMGSTLQYRVEIIKVLKLAEDGVPYRPCFFSLIDTDGRCVRWVSRRVIVEAWGGRRDGTWGGCASSFCVLSPLTCTNISPRPRPHLQTRAYLCSEDLDELELKHHFARIKKPMPPHVMSEDKDGNGRISFDECARLPATYQPRSDLMCCDSRVPVPAALPVPLLRLPLGSCQACQPCCWPCCSPAHCSSALLPGLLLLAKPTRQACRCPCTWLVVL